MPEDPPAKVPTAPHRDRARGQVGLLIVDMINCFDFAEAGALFERAKGVARTIVALRAAARAADAPVIYVNDHFGEWHSEKSLLIERALKGGNPVTEQILPADDDYFIIKPQFSGFYATSLPVLLPKLGVSRLVIAGIATDICVLFTAADAHMRDYALWVPEDAVASPDEKGAWALDIMRNAMGAETTPSSRLTLAQWTARLDENGIR